MPLHCIGEKRSPTHTDDDSDEEGSGDMISFWQEAPDSILLHIFWNLDVRELGFVGQICKSWKRVSFDESLWRNLMRGYLGLSECSLPPGKRSWRMEVKRFINHRPVVLTETLHDHTDEVLHVSFSHDGKLFSTTSKDATLKIWTLGNPTTLKYSKDFRELLGWDFTQYSCFNHTDTMVLVSSVKTTAYMDRRGYMAVLSLIHNFEILKIVTMDPSQLFGAWLDNSTFLGGSLEISLDRFATTVQIEAYDVPEIYSPLPRPPSPVVEESSGQTLFTFSSETASLIKFLTVALIKPPLTNLIKADKTPENTEKILTKVSPSVHLCKSDHASCSYTSDLIDDVNTSEPDCNLLMYDKDSSSSRPEATEAKTWRTSSEVDNKESVGVCVKCCPQSGSSIVKSAKFKTMCSECKLNNNRLMKRDRKDKVKETNVGIKPSDIRRIRDLEKTQREKKSSRSSLSGGASSFGESLEDFDFSFPEMKTKDNSVICDSGQNSVADMQQKNLIFVTGEFAVALHQLGFKNVPAYAKESILSRGITPMEEDNPDSFMVVNYSNNDIHFVRRQQEPDKPDSLLDLHGHVTGLCLTADQRYLFINCRPWIGNVDRTDPWATPDLSSNIEIRIIDLVMLKDLGVRYHGHKGFSPSNMCCFVFLDVSDDYVASGSEDSQGYLWDRHYGALVAKFEHESGVVNAVGFNPTNQEILVTVSDDGTIKLWRSKHEASLFFDNAM